MQISRNLEAAEKLPQQPPSPIISREVSIIIGDE
jgi:hypothetical protein